MDCLAQDFRNRHILDMLQRYSRRNSDEHDRGVVRLQMMIIKLTAPAGRGHLSKRLELMSGLEPRTAQA